MSFDDDTHRSARTTSSQRSVVSKHKLTRPLSIDDEMQARLDPMLSADEFDAWQSLAEKVIEDDDDDHPLVVVSEEGRSGKVYHWMLYERPYSRADCQEGGFNEQRPCPYVACRHHMLWWWVSPEDAASRDLRLDRLSHTCVLDIIEEKDDGYGEGDQLVDPVMTHDEISRETGVTPQRVHQIELRATTEFRRAWILAEIGASFAPDPSRFGAIRRPAGPRNRPVVSLTSALREVHRSMPDILRSDGMPASDDALADSPEEEDGI